MPLFLIDESQSPERGYVKLTIPEETRSLPWIQTREGRSRYYQDGLAAVYESGNHAVLFNLAYPDQAHESARELITQAQDALFDLSCRLDMTVYLSIPASMKRELRNTLPFDLEHYLDMRILDLDEEEEDERNSIDEFSDWFELHHEQSSPLLKEILLPEPEERFSDLLMKYIEQAGISEVACYQKANLDRRLFSKIRSNPDYIPKKTTVVALCFGLGLGLEDAQTLLERAGYALSPSLRADQIYTYHFERGTRDIYTVNQDLYLYSLPLLGSMPREAA